MVSEANAKKMELLQRLWADPKGGLTPLLSRSKLQA